MFTSEVAVVEFPNKEPVMEPIIEPVMCPWTTSSEPVTTVELNRAISISLSIIIILFSF